MRQYLIVIVLLTGFVLKSMAQIAVDFSASVQSGCAPTLVLFVDNSTTTGNAINTWDWDFGDGSTANSLTGSVTHTYAQSGTYNVTLTVSNGTNTGTTTKNGFITIYDDPQVDFVFNPSTGCEPLLVNFVDNSTGGNGASIVSWNWSTSNGKSSTLPGPMLWFNTNGVYDVSLEVTDSHGCTSSKDSIGIIDVIEGPTTAFNVINGSRFACDPPHTVNFNANSSGGTGPYTYFWDFNAQGTSTAATPTITYTNYGNYGATLITTDANGCRDTLTRGSYIRINNPTADFTFPNQTFCEGDTVLFTNTSSGANSYLWDIAGLDTSTSTDTAYAFLSGGTYAVKLVVGSSTGCADSITKYVSVETPNVSFTSSPNYNCEVPHTVNYQGISTNQVASWNWSFGNGNTASTQNPSNTFNAAGTYTDQLEIVTVNGCSASTTIPNNVYLFEMNTGISASPTQGCIPLNVNFTDNSTPFDSIATWFWDFGDGGTSTLQNPSHIYTQHGTFTATLTITTTSGCIYTEQVTITPGAPQTASFTASSLVFCASDPVSFTNNSFDQSLIQNYQWNFGDGNSSNQFAPNHQYLDTGYFDVSLTVTYNGCSNTTTLQDYLYVNGPVVSFNHIIDCDNPYDVTFVPTMIGETSWHWDYDDGSPFDSNIVSPVHSFSQSGNFNVELTAFDSVSGCSFDFDQVVKTRDVVADFTISDTTACGFVPITLDGTVSIDESNYNWTLQDGVPANPTNGVVNPYFTSIGIKNLRLIAIDVNGCRDTLEQQIRVFQPVADFVADTLFGCKGLQVQFTDLSTSDTGVASWIYDFDNGNTSSLQNPSQTFNAYQQGGYDIQLITTDVMGCSDTMTKPAYINVIQPFPDFVADTQTCEQGQTVFTNLSTGQGWTYFWDFGDGNTSTTTHPIHTYTSGGLYDISFTVTDSIGCDSTIVRTNHIDVQPLPIVNFGVDQTYSACWPFDVQFTDSTISAYIDYYTWDFGDTSQLYVTTDSVVDYTYNFSGNIDVGLIVTTTYGCTDTLYQPGLIEIEGPFALFSNTPDTICVGEEVTFNVDTSINVLNMTFDFGDSTSSSLDGNITSTTHMFNQTGEIIIDIVYIDTNGVCPKYDTLDIFVGQVIADWNLPDTILGCAPYEFIAEDLSTGGNVWLWDFDDGTTSPLDSLVYTYTGEGDYNLSLAITNDSTHCTDTLYTYVDINNYPETETYGETFICDGEMAPLTVLGGLYYQWSDAEYLTNATISNPRAFPSVSTRFYVSVTDDIGCLTVDSVDVYVQTAPEILSFPTDTTIFENALFEFPVILNQEYIVSWTPSADLNCWDCTLFSTMGNSSERYLFTVQDSNGCFLIDSAFTLTVDNKYTAFIPNAFTPNGDGYNDVFKIEAYGVVELKSFVIYDRWGIQVYSGNNIDQGWDGYYNGEKAKENQIYMYKAEVVMFNGDTRELSGTVFLKSQ